MMHHIFIAGNATQAFARTALNDAKMAEQFVIESMPIRHNTSIANNYLKQLANEATDQAIAQPHLIIFNNKQAVTELLNYFKTSHQTQASQLAKFCYQSIFITPGQATADYLRTQLERYFHDFGFGLDLDLDPTEQARENKNSATVGFNKSTTRSTELAGPIIITSANATTIGIARAFRNLFSQLQQDSNLSKRITTELNRKETSGNDVTKQVDSLANHSCQILLLTSKQSKLNYQQIWQQQLQQSELPLELQQYLSTAKWQTCQVYHTEFNDTAIEKLLTSLATTAKDLTQASPQPKNYKHLVIKDFSTLTQLLTKAAANSLYDFCSHYQLNSLIYYHSDNFKANLEKLLNQSSTPQLEIKQVQLQDRLKETVTQQKEVATHQGEATTQQKKVTTQQTKLHPDQPCATSSPQSCYLLGLTDSDTNILEPLVELFHT